MSFYDASSSGWQGPAHQSSWDQPAPPSRSGASSTTSREEGAAFVLQFEEVERAIDNLMKSGKFFPGPRRDLGHMGMSRPFSDFDPRMGSPSRHPSMDFDPMRSHSASNLQNYYATARYQPRNSEVDQVQQAKRRMAAQRERELRNYHQEQQYNRSIFSQSGKSDRSVSPNAMNEEERRELIARQHRALYGSAETASPSSAGAPSSFYEGPPDSQVAREGAGPANTGVPNSASGARGPSPLAYNSFGVPEPASAVAPSGANEELGAHTKAPSPNASGQRSRANSTSSPASAAPNYSLFDGSNAPAGAATAAIAAKPATSAAPQTAPRTSTSSPGGSPPRSGGQPGKIGAPAPIGTRPINPALSKRATPPAASPLSYGFAPGETGAGLGGAPEVRAGSAASNPSAAAGAREAGAGASKDGVGWVSGSGVWGKPNLSGVQASVWG